MEPLNNLEFSLFLRSFRTFPLNIVLNPDELEFRNANYIHLEASGEIKNTLNFWKIVNSRNLEP